jgi:hypothetical protein
MKTHAIIENVSKQRIGKHNKNGIFGKGILYSVRANGYKEVGWD